ncbi:MAG: diphosphate--fructose-6-phosphate 1-phosphotransferase [Treponema sp.]|nr:diphosphate--fructose-6-phosphate 1-phosphotransferase [Treponema sp.]MDY3755736.1 diphosphate--fructose-6-phosphate 1-phosphotransferase [Treponema sp.]
MKGNVLIVHGGAPTAVINASLYGAITEAKKYAEVDKIYGARGGSGAIASGDFIDLTNIPQEQLERLPFTPGSAIGTSRTPLVEADYKAIAEALKKHNIKWLLFNGGNGSMDACGKVAAQVKDTDIRVVGIPKTIDNDIAITDHAPGFGSAARYLAASVRELCYDVASLPIHVAVIEAMGRNAGWLTAASALAGTPENGGPHLIYVPEKPFNQEEFLDKASTLYKKHGGVVVVASEGLKDATGTPIVPPIFQVGRAVYYGDVSAHLANLVIQKLGIKARSEKPGILGRTSTAWQSEIDRQEAIVAGQEAMRAALAGETAVMVGFRRFSDSSKLQQGYNCETFLIPVEEVMLKERTLEERYINPAADGITQEFVQWCRPLIGGSLPKFPRFS